MTGTEVAKQTAEKSPQTVLQVFSSDSFKRQIASALPKHISADSMMRVVLTEVRMNKDLEKCTVSSFMGAMLKAAQAGLRPGMFGEGWIIPRYNSKLGCNEAAFQPGYQGLVQLAYRSGEVADIAAEPVYKSDHFDYQLGSNPKIVHTPDFDAEHKDEDIIAFYAVVKLINGGTLMKVMPRRDVDAIRDKYGPHTRAGKLVGPWVDSYAAMGAKTVLLQVIKFTPKDPEKARQLAAALQAENDAIFTDRLADGMADGTRGVADRVAERLGADTSDDADVVEGEYEVVAEGTQVAEEGDGQGQL